DLAAHLKDVEIGVTAREPLTNAHWVLSFRLPGEPTETLHQLEYQEVSPAYFGVLGVPIMSGRHLEPGDETPPAIIVNESMARRYFSGENPVGKSIIANQQVREIVGVTRDACVAYLEGVSPLMFQPFTGRQIPKLLVRSNAPGVVDQISSVVKQ